MAPPTPIPSLDALAQALNAAGVTLTRGPDGHSIEIETGATDLPGKLLVRWDSLYPFVQIIQPLVIDVPPDRIPAVEAAMGRLNNVAKVAGLSLDYPTRLLHYRLTAAVLIDGVRLDLFQAYLHGAVTNARALRGVMEKVVGGLAGEDVLQNLGENPPN